MPASSVIMIQSARILEITQSILNGSQMGRRSILNSAFIVALVMAAEGGCSVVQAAQSTKR
jgi:hypothetical protein